MADPTLIRHSFTVLGSPAELYEAWRRLENLPSFLKHVDAVESREGNRSRWSGRESEDPDAAAVEWELEVVEDVGDRQLVWRGIEGPRGTFTIAFTPATGGRGTVVSAMLSDEGGSTVSRLFGKKPETGVRDDLRRFKQIAETGEIPTIQGQSSGRGRDREASRDVRAVRAPGQGSVRREREVTP